MKKNILILGSSGMLGLMVFDFFQQNTNYSVTGTIRNTRIKDFENFPNHIELLDGNSNFKEQFSKIFNNRHYDYIINCIGVIKLYCNTSDSNDIKNAITINSIFPHDLNKFVKEVSPETKIIQIATDCVYDGKKGKYIEPDLHNPTDVYGKTKSLGEVCDDNFLNIRCSIIGPEKYNKTSLLEWFLSQPENKPIYGYDHHRWNGITTLQFAQYCHEIISYNLFDQLRHQNYCIHYVKNETVTKFELLNTFIEIFKTKHTINKVSNTDYIYRDLSTIYPKKTLIKMHQAIFELQEYSKKSLFFNI